jgi:hypothetical protein
MALGGPAGLGIKPSATSRSCLCTSMASIKIFQILLFLLFNFIIFLSDMMAMATAMATGVGIQPTNRQ